MELLHLLQFLLLLGSGLLVPGWLLGRALGTPGGPAGALLGSAALLTNLLLLLDAFGVRLDASRIAVALIVLCAALAVIARLRPRPPVGTTPARIPWRWQPWHWLLIPVVAALVAIVVRVGVEPLSGFDCFFRWDFLARQIVRTGTLKFYPAMSADDFLHYGWCDGIAPLVSSLYAWSYLALGRIEAWATTPVVVAQALLIFYLAARLAAKRSGPAAGATATALLATSPVLLWAVAMGQETGLTALSTIAMFWFIEQGRDAPQARWWVWAGLAAGTGALAREYGLALFPLGVLALWNIRAPRRAWLEFIVAATVIAFPWYLRNWIKTGHPLYSLGLGPLFPTNPISIEYFRVLAARNSIFDHAAVTVPLLAKLVAVLAGVPLVIGLVVGLRRWRTYGAWLVTVFAFIGLWLWSIPATSGGYAYSLRVLAPAIVLTAVMGGIGLARFAGARRGWIMALALSAIAVHAGVTSLYLPIYYQPAWWRETPMAWHLFGQLRQRWGEQAQWQTIVDAAEGRKILVSDPVFHALFTDHGAHAVPLFSPEVRFLFEPATKLAEAVPRLRAAGYRFILISRGNSIMDAQLDGHPFFVALAATKPVASSNLYFLYDLYPAELRQPDPPAPVHVP